MSRAMVPPPLVTPQLNSHYREWWGEWEGYAVEKLFPFEEAGCWQPRYYHAPSNDLENLSTDPGYLQYALALPPGGWLWSFLHFQTSDLFVFQVTDTALNHKFFSSPVPNTYLHKGNNRMPWILPCLHPIIEPGIFMVEFWLTASPSAVCSMTFGVLEVERNGD